MKLSLSTNWCNRRIESGEEIAELAMRLGFDELELGYHTTIEQAQGFKRMRDQIPVGSVHSFCPVPISAPQGYPELYQLASFDDEARKMARFQILRNVRFAADIGADTVVLHAGRVMCYSWFESWQLRRRKARGRKMLEVFRRELEAIVPELEKAGVTLALENLPYFEGFPNEEERVEIVKWNLGDRVKGWFDTGHARVAHCSEWSSSEFPGDPSEYAGMHLNDVVDVNDDHFAPGFGGVDFASVREFAEKVGHVVFEPAPTVRQLDLIRGITNIKKVWNI